MGVNPAGYAVKLTPMRGRQRRRSFSGSESAVINEMGRKAAARRNLTNVSRPSSRKRSGEKPGREERSSDINIWPIGIGGHHACINVSVPEVPERRGKWRSNRSRSSSAKSGEASSGRRLRSRGSRAGDGADGRSPAKRRWTSSSARCSRCLEGAQEGRHRRKIAKPLGGVLKAVAKKALPFVGGALGSFIPIPGVGTAIGGALGSAVSKALELEFGELERRRRSSRWRDASCASPRPPPRRPAAAPPTANTAAAVNQAVVSAARQHLPGADLSALGRWRRASARRSFRPLVSVVARDIVVVGA